MNEVTRKWLLSIGGAILLIVVYGIALKVSDYGGLDTASSRHANLAAARLDGVIERGGFQFPNNDLEAFKKQVRQLAGTVVTELPGNMTRIKYVDRGSRIELFLAPSPQKNLMTGVWSMKPDR